VRSAKTLVGLPISVHFREVRDTLEDQKILRETSAVPVSLSFEQAKFWLPDRNVIVSYGGLPRGKVAPVGMLPNVETVPIDDTLELSHAQVEYVPSVFEFENHTLGHVRSRERRCRSREEGYLPKDEVRSGSVGRLAMGQCRGHSTR
jgi:hypothetical protein